MEIKLNNGQALPFDILIHEDDCDIDCLQIQPNILDPILKTYSSSNGRRIDVIKCNQLNKKSVISNGSPSFQSIEMMLTINTIPNSQKGKELIDKSREDFSLDYIKQYYYYLSMMSCLFAMDSESYDYKIRSKMGARVLREFYPKAEALSQVKTYSQLDCMIKPIELKNVLNKLFGQNLPNKETILKRISESYIQKIKSKLDSYFLSEFIQMLNDLGVGQFLNDNLKRKLLELVQSNPLYSHVNEDEELKL